MSGPHAAAVAPFLPVSLIPCVRQLIPVSQPNALPEVSEHQAKHDEYARLFNERFRSVRRNRPASASASAPEDEASWLESVAGNQGDEQLEHVIPAQGRLTIQFGSR